MGTQLERVKKRDGTIRPFDREKIVRAIHKAMLAAHEGSEQDAKKVATRVVATLRTIVRTNGTKIPTVEMIQDVVEEELMFAHFTRTAKHYILYRRERSSLREQGIAVPEHVRKLVTDSKHYFRNPLAEFVFYRTYARWIEGEKRRETWIEAVDRYIAFMRENLGGKLTEAEYDEIRTAILNQRAMPSMRLLWSAGEAARKTNVCAYNCAFIAPKVFQDFGEIMYLLMCGTGVGFSVESQHVHALPQILKQTGIKLKTHVIADSKEGWANAFVLGMKTWFSGKDIDFDYSKLRPAGARLHTMGGKSSGPEPLRALINFARERILQRQGRHLSTLDAHDIICKIGDIVVSGGVRRSALISLSDLDDHEMRHAKDGQFYLAHPHRSMANNSAVYTSKPDNTVFLEEWIALMKSGSGERGIFNRGGLEKQLPARRWKTFQKHLDSCGCNPCGEVILRSKQFCNLTEIVAREDDTEASLLKKARLAAILGTYQSTLTYFPYLSKEWGENCEEERLLGVSITGQWDCKAVRNARTLEKLRNIVNDTNKIYAKRFGVNQSTCTTVVKPSGTVSQLVDSASGMHPRHAPYYIRRIRITGTDSLFRMLRDQGVPYHPEVGQTMANAITFVFEFPVAAPQGTVYKDTLTAIEQLEYWHMVKTNYTEHNPSITVSVGPDEWLGVGNWLYEHWDQVGGLSFLPRSDYVYQLAPYEVIDRETYLKLSKRFKDIDFSKIMTYEIADDTNGSKELACVAGNCEI
ncbi:MAG: ribonucleoside-triphosphate reductase [Parcubacteria group bacterium RIFCSPHIGHO2_01_FULL_47_10b]|nr:MAG: ribonucleoside-triphosphate reductase [Parcubacteria group bacterium RIFCSPHIGHO2_01_FULL_47_10b]